MNGVEIEMGGKKFQEYGPVVVATGGYGADQTEDSLLKKYRPDLTGRGRGGYGVVCSIPLFNVGLGFGGLEVGSGVGFSKPSS